MLQQKHPVARRAAPPRCRSRRAAACREELCSARTRLLSGAHKLVETNAAVTSMRADLAALQPALEAKAAACTELLARVDADSAEAEAVRRVVEAEEAEVAAMQRSTQVGGRVGQWVRLAG